MVLVSDYTALCSGFGLQRGGPILGYNPRCQFRVAADVGFDAVFVIADGICICRTRFVGSRMEGNSKMHGFE